MSSFKTMIKEKFLERRETYHLLLRKSTELS